METHTPQFILYLEMVSFRSHSRNNEGLLCQMKGVSEIYHLPMAVCPYGGLNRNAWQPELVHFARHEVLSSVFVSIDRQPRVRFLAARSGIPIRWKDLRGVSDAEAQLNGMSIDESTDSFDLVQGPLVRILMVQLDGNDMYSLLLSTAL